ncbi:MAG TPA: hypothetical protein VG892_07545, partial [Terriglobales bacterium]|nr:hypothetical protein [Terriglobales bacterium]
MTIIQDAYLELGLGDSAPQTVIGNADPQVKQLLALSNAEGQSFCKLQGPWGGWPELNRVYTFNLVPVGPYTGDTTSGSAVITNMSDTTGIVVGYGLAGGNIYQSATVTAVDSIAGTVTMSAVASGTDTGVSINFGQILYDLPSDIRSFV